MARKPLPTWRDDDRTRFDLHIIDLGHRFRQTERVAAIMRKQQTAAPTPAGSDDTPATSAVAPRHPKMQELHTQLQHTLTAQGETLTDAQRVEVLWDILSPLIERTTEGNEL